ncbi:homoserine dehydrogenase [Bacillus sp. B1-b2]|nr:homoserine dehydrogenase [Bacillus sp. B1-b2]
MIITGYGIVAKEFCKLIVDKAETIKDKYGFTLTVTGIIGSKGMIYQQEGLDLQTLIEDEIGSNALIEYSKKKQVSFINPIYEADVLVECTPTNVENGEPGLSYILEAIHAGADIVSVSKGALVHSFPLIKKVAANKESRLKFSGATAAALPTIDIGDDCLSGCTITKIEGILNGTSNFILTSMNNENISFEDALQIAKERGIAEANPSLDIKGFDSAYKILLLANELFGMDYTIKDVAIEGIEKLTSERMEEIAKRKKRVKLIASAYRENDQTILEVKPTELDENHPLFYVNGTNKGILFETEEMGTICATGGASHPKGAAAAALKDVINLYKNEANTQLIRA